MGIFGGDQVAQHAVPAHILAAAKIHPDIIYDTKYGRNPDVDAAEDIVSAGSQSSGVYTGMPVDANGSMLTVGENFELVCASADDDSAGTGCQAVEFTYLDDTGVLRTGEVATDGLTPVDTGLSGIRAFRLRGATFGSSGTNAGLITLRHITTTANIFATIETGVGQSEIAALTVPLGYVGLFEQAAVKPDRAGSVTLDAALHGRREGQNGFVRKHIIRVSNTDAPFDTGVLWEPELTDVKLRVTTVSTTNVDVAGQFNYWLLRL